jgi:hypothetical protein
MHSRSRESPEKVAEWYVCIPGCGISGEDAEFVSCIFMFTPWTLLVDRTSIIMTNFITHSHKGSNGYLITMNF